VERSGPGMAKMGYVGGDLVVSWLGGGVAWNREMDLVRGHGWDCDAATAIQRRELSSCCHPSVGRAPFIVLGAICARNPGA